MQAEGRRRREEWWKTTTIVVAWIRRTTESWWPTDGNGTGVFFVLIKKRKKSVIKSRCLPTMIYWSGSFAPAPSRLILIYSSGSRNSFDVRARLKGCRGGKLETFSRRPCFRADTILLLRVGNWYRLYNVRPVNFYTYEIERFERNSSLITTTAA